MAVRPHPELNPFHADRLVVLRGEDLPRLRYPVAGLRELDGRAWGAGIAVSAYGVRLGVRAEHSSVLLGLGDVLPPGWRSVTGPSPRVDRLYSLVFPQDGPPLVYDNATSWIGLSSFPWPDVLEQLTTSRVVRLATRYVFVHSGVVAWQDRAIVIPGDSRSGKTTLVAALIRAGATYYSDDFAVIDSSGLVRPYARPLKIRRSRFGEFDRHRVEELGGRRGINPIPMGAVVLAPYEEGAGWQPHTLSRTEGLALLMMNSMQKRRRPEWVLDALTRAASHAVMIGSSRGDADETARRILETASTLT